MQVAQAGRVPQVKVTWSAKVPMLVRSPVISPGNKVAIAPTNKNSRIFDLYGVLNFGCKVENTFGSKPSVDMV